MTAWNIGKSIGKILVIGDLMLDRQIIGLAEDFHSEEQASIIDTGIPRYFPGGSASLASNIRKMGGQVTLAGVIGKDEEGEILRKILNQKEIPAVLGVEAGRPTTVREFIRSRQQTPVQVDRNPACEISIGIFNDILKVVALLLEDIRLITISDYGIGVVTRGLIAAVSEICAGRNIPILIDARVTDFSKYRGADVIKSDIRCMESFYGREIRDITVLEKSAEIVFSETGCTACIIVKDGNGVILFHSPRKWIHYTLAAVGNLIDDSEAVDIFMAGLSMAICQGLPVESACMAASEAVSAMAGETVR